MIINCNENDYQYQNVTYNTTKKCIGAFAFYVYARLNIIVMSEEKVSILLSDVSIQGDLVEKEKIILDAKINGDISAEEVVTHNSSNISGNIKAKNITVGGKIKGNLNSDKIKLTSSADVDGVLSQKSLSVEEGANLKIKSETYK